MQNRNPLASPKYFAQDSLFVLLAHGVVYGFNTGPDKRRYYTNMMCYLPPNVLNLPPTLVNRHCAKFAKKIKKKNQKEAQDPFWDKIKAQSL